MALKERLVSIYNNLAPEGWQVNFREAAGSTSDTDEPGWRRLTDDSSRNLPATTQERMLEIAHWLWEQNPIARGIVELGLAYLLAEGVRVTVTDPENQKALDKFWRDPINDMDIKLVKKARELALFGEQIYPIFEREVDGTVRIGYLDPKAVAQVVKDPDNPEQPIGIITKRDTKGRYFKYRVVINGPETVFTNRTQGIRQTDFPDGEVFYFRVNDLSAGGRGRSDLLHLADWLDAYDQFLFGEAERYKLQRAVVWDLELKNANADVVKQRAREFQLPQAGGTYVHNDSEKLEAKTPDLAAQDTSAGARLLRNHILGGARVPEHWFGGAGEVNRATAAEMGGPTFKDLAMRQRVLKHMLESMARYVLWAKAKADGKADVDWSDPAWNPQAVMPELVADDLDKSSAALQKVVTAAAAALQEGLLSRKTALALIGAVAGRLGIDIDVDEELEEAEAEAAKRAEGDVFTDPAGSGGGGKVGEPAAKATGG